MLLALFALLFYSLCFLCSKRYIGAGEGGSIMGLYWAASALLLAIATYRDFPKMYRATLRRMRLYSAVRWLFQWYVGFSIMFLPFLYFVLRDYSNNARHALDECSIQLLVGAYGASVFSIVFFYTVASNITAKVRGIRCFRA